METQGAGEYGACSQQAVGYGADYGYNQQQQPQRYDHYGGGHSDQDYQQYYNGSQPQQQDVHIQYDNYGQPIQWDEEGNAYDCYGNVIYYDYYGQPIDYGYYGGYEEGGDNVMDPYGVAARHEAKSVKTGYEPFKRTRTQPYMVETNKKMKPVTVEKEKIVRKEKKKKEKKRREKKRREKKKHAHYIVTTPSVGLGVPARYIVNGTDVVVCSSQCQQWIVSVKGTQGMNSQQQQRIVVLLPPSVTTPPVLATITPPQQQQHIYIQQQQPQVIHAQHPQPPQQFTSPVTVIQQALPTRSFISYYTPFIQGGQIYKQIPTILNNMLYTITYR